MALLQPKKLKFKKYHKKMSNFTKINYFKNELQYGTFGLKVLEDARISARQLEATRKIIRRTTKRLGILWIKKFPQIPISAKPSEIRMGKGKGSTAYWACFVKKYSILFELTGLKTSLAFKALKAASTKLPIKTSIIKKSK